jgi:hypothetical protein|tara:strand:- start:4727 stop:4990 length:264 start_codon:yes stop_codon:yes gene_type:complete
MATIKLLSTSASLGVANNMGNATMVRVINTASAEVTLTVANTVGPENGGGQAGSVVLEAGASEIIVKEPTDTVIAAADTKATAVARY